MINKLNLIQTETDIISKGAQEVKFKYNKEDFIYPITYKEKLKSFVKCYRFLQNLYQSLVIVNTNKEISDKIYAYYKQLDEIYFEGEFLLNSIKKDIHFGNNIIEDKIKNLVYNNNLTINQVIDEIFPVGRRVVLYNPDENVGIA